MRSKYTLKTYFRYRKDLFDPEFSLKFLFVPNILGTCVPLYKSPLDSRIKGFYNELNGTSCSIIDERN